MAASFYAYKSMPKLAITMYWQRSNALFLTIQAPTG